MEDPLTSKTPTPINEKDVRAFYNWLDHQPNEYTEVRIIAWPSSGSVIQRWVQSEEGFVDICREWSGKRQIYAGINPRKREGGSAGDIARVTGIPFDIDSDRDPEVACTTQELEAARNKLNVLASWMRDKGFEQPFVAMSGNGFHAISKVNISITEDLPQKLETYFHEVKNAVNYELDSIFDLPRIIKVPGTMSIKGMPTTERPHRLSKIISLGSNSTDIKLRSHIDGLKDYTPLGLSSETTIETGQEKKVRTRGLRPCFKRFAEKGGRLSPDQSEDHILRLALVQEAHVKGYSRIQIIDLFRNSDDFKEGITSKQVDYELEVIKRNGSRPWRCLKIYKHKGCLGEDCPHFKVRLRKYLPKEPSSPLDPARFFEEDLRGKPTRFVPKWLADAILEEYQFLAFSEKSDIWCYNPDNGIWEPYGAEIIQEECAGQLQQLFRSNYVTEVHNYIRYTNYVDRDIFEGNPELIVMENGVFNLYTEEFMPFNPGIYATTAIPIIYDAKAEAPKIEKFLTDICPDDKEKLVEYAGYCLYKAMPIARVLILVGAGQNGKTTYLNLISAFLGKQNKSSVTMQKLSEGGFRCAELYLKLANLCGDIPSKPIKDAGPLKMLTGQDPMTIERKYHDPFQYYNYAKPAFSANKIPPSWDDTIAFHRRMVTIDFTAQFPAEDPKTDIHILDKLTTLEELSGFFNLAAKGLKKFLSQKGFTGEKTAETRKMTYIRKSDPVQYFALQFIEKAIGQTITNPQLYEYYTRLCFALEVTPIANTWFSRNIRRYLPYSLQRREKIDGVQTRVWHGICVKFNELDKFIRKSGTPLTTPLWPTKKGKSTNGANDIPFQQIPPGEPCEKCGKHAVEYLIKYDFVGVIKRCEACFQEARRESPRSNFVRAELVKGRN